jgi:hypothetical protein
MSHMAESRSEEGEIEGSDKGNRMMGIANKWEATVWMECEEGKKTGWMLFSGSQCVP